MKGKSNFTKSECAILKRLIKRKVNSNKSEQKNIRNEMRDMNFYYYCPLKLFDSTKN